MQTNTNIIKQQKPRRALSDNDDNFNMAHMREKNKARREKQRTASRQVKQSFGV